MVWVEGGWLQMGSDRIEALPEERPSHAVKVSGFWIDRTEVTNAQFAAFVEATGYRTTAELPVPAEVFTSQLEPGAPPPSAEDLQPGSTVFVFPTQEEVGHWEWVHGADWRHPEGPGSSIAERMDHPVVQVSCQDAEAYARWADKQLPSEAQWEWAARGGLLDAPYSWGEASPDSEPALLNKWQGSFPVFNTQRDGFLASAPVGQFPPNGYGLSDMSGNVWEWCADGWNAHLYQTRAGERPQTDPVNPPEPTAASAFRSLRGGSFLCSDDYCTRYRVSARTGTTADSATNHIGFRCVRFARD
ncbi:MAG: formylglycine-generating enzyme family protein [Planctomycetota bacterium]